MLEQDERRQDCKPSAASLTFIAAVVLIVCSAIALIHSQISRNARLTNLDVSQGDFPTSFLMFSKTEKDRCHLVDRRDSTVRRSRQALPGKTWDVKRFRAATADNSAEHFLLRSKRHGTVFFIPVESVEDREYPFLYEFVRKEYEELDLPRVTWTRLYENRIYRGLYLRMHLPFDLRRKDGGPAIRRELLSVRGNRMTIVDTRFHPEGRLYARCIVNGHFPSLSPPSAALAWLYSKRSLAEHTYLLNNLEPFTLTLLPLPVSLDTLLQAVYEKPPQVTIDDRLQQWTRAASLNDGADLSPFSSAQRQRFEAGLARYKTAFGGALRVHCLLANREGVATL